MHPLGFHPGISPERFFGALAAYFRAAIILAAIVVNAFALDPLRPLSGYIRTNFTVEDGLSTNKISAVLQTRDGFLWVGTSESLTHFDGRHFTTVKFLPQAMQHVSVNALAKLQMDLCGRVRVPD